VGKEAYGGGKVTLSVRVAKAIALLGRQEAD